jgi:predicted esterase YcpF (UPF0227 family)
MSGAATLEIIKDKELLIISFAGSGSSFNNMPIFEFKNFLTTHFPKVSLLFLKDDNLAWYNQGIVGISTDVHTTAEYLRKKIQSYKRVMFIGSSAGGYAAILFGSLLRVNMVVAFRPQTKLNKPCIKPQYSDLKQFINNTTLYHIYGETCNPPDSLHVYSQCENISGPANVILYKHNTLDLKHLRDNGWLLKEFTGLINDCRY